MLALACVFAFTACGGSEGGGNYDGWEEVEVKSVTLWAGGQWVGSDYENLKSFINEYNETAALGFTIKLESKSDLETAFATSLRTGKQPDMLIWDRFNTPTYSKQGFLAPMEEMIARDKVDTSLYHPEAMKEMVYDGHTYGLPLDLDTWGIYVNMDMVAAYNNKPENASSQIDLKDDWTWEEMLGIAKKLTQKNADGSIRVAGYSAEDLQEHLYKYAVSTGVDFIKDGKTNFDNEQIRDVLKFFKEVKDAGVYSGGMQQKSSFTSGQLAMVNNPTYYADYIKSNAASMNFKFMPQPRYSKEGGVNGGMIGGYGIAFPKPTKRYDNKEWKARNEASWRFAKWWLTDEANILKWSSVSNTLPAMTKTYENDVIKNNPTLNSAAKFVSNYKIRPQVPGFLNLQTKVINTQVKNYLDGNMDLDQCIAKLTSAGNQELK